MFKVKVCTVCMYVQYICVRACVCIAGAWLLVQYGSEVEAYLGVCSHTVMSSVKAVPTLSAVRSS